MRRPIGELVPERVLYSEDVAGSFAQRLLRYRWRIAAAALFLLLGAFIGSTLWTTTETLNRSAQTVRSAQEVGFTVGAVQPSSIAGAEHLNGPSDFRSVAAFEGKLWACGPGGLYRYTADGKLEAQWRTGLELPPAPLAAMATGVGGGSAGPQLWIATDGEGLLTLGSAGLRRIRPKERDHAAITALLPLTTAKLLYGTRTRGVFIYDGSTVKRFHPSLADIPVVALAGNETEVWVATRDRGLLHLRAGRLARFDEAGGLPDKHVFSLAIAPDGAVYAGTGLGIAEFRDGRFRRTLAQGLFARSLAVQGNALWVGTLADGVHQIPLELERPHERAVAPLNGAVEHLTLIAGQITAASGSAIYTFGNDGTWQAAITAPAGVLTDRNISALNQDASGALWVGYFDRGIDVLASRNAPAVHMEDENLFCVNRIAHNAKERITAVATANGLVLFDGAARRKQVLLRGDGLISSHVTDAVFHPEGMVLATPAGLTFFDRSGPRSLYAFHGLVNNHAYSLAAAGGDLLVGTLGGLSMLHDGVVRANYTAANSPLRQNWITAVAPDADGWFIGTYGGGILRLTNAGEWQRFRDLPGGVEVNPNALLVTPERVYAGSLRHGLLVYDRAGGRWKATVRGLPSVNVTALLASQGKLYAGTDNGLALIPEANL